MRIKTIFLLVVAVLITILLMQNNEDAKFNILFVSGVYLSKMTVMLAVAIASFVAGIIIAQPRRYRIDTNEHHGEEDHNEKTDTLSDEDRDYIS